MTSATSVLKGVTASGFDAEVLQSPVPVLVDFWAEWCAPCHMQIPILERVAQVMGPRIRVVKVNADEEAAIAVRYGIQGLPTLLVFVGGQPVAKLLGVQSQRALMSALENVVG